MSHRASIASVAMAVPERRVSNAQIAEALGVDEDWIVKRTGASERPWAAEGERMTDFAANAARQALGTAGVEPAALDLVVVATSSADEITPNTAPLVAGMVGAAGAAAFDVGAACTGWLAGLAMVSGQIEAGRARNAVVVGADFLSRFLDLRDRETAPLFADGAGAAVVSAVEDGRGSIGPVVRGVGPALSSIGPVLRGVGAGRQRV